MPQIPKPFSANCEDEHLSLVRNIPSSQPTTIGPSDSSVMVSPQSTEEPRQQNIFTQNISPQDLPKLSELLLHKLALKSEVPDIREVKEESTKTLLTFVDKYDKELQQKERELLNLSKRIGQLEAERRKQTEHLYATEERLEIKEGQIKQLQDSINQKDRELKSKKDQINDLLDSQCQKRVSVLEQALKAKKVELEKMMQEKNDMEGQFKRVYEQIKKATKEAERVERRASKHKKENIQLKKKLRQSFLEEMKKLETKMTRHKNILITHHFFIVIVFIICIVAALLQKCP